MRLSASEGWRHGYEKRHRIEMTFDRARRDLTVLRRFLGGFAKRHALWNFQFALRQA